MAEQLTSNQKLFDALLALVNHRAQYRDGSATELWANAYDALDAARLADEPSGAADLIREAFATMQSHAERHARKSNKAKGDHWPAQHAEFAKRSEEWCVRAQAFLDGAPQPPSTTPLQGLLSISMRPYLPHVELIYRFESLEQAQLARDAFLPLVTGGASVTKFGSPND